MRNLSVRLRMYGSCAARFHRRLPYTPFDTSNC